MSFEHAVFAEYSLSLKKMALGANVRVFNTIEVPSRGGITLDPQTGYITLTPGTYHVTAVSIVTPYTDGDTEQVALLTKPWAGYCRLRRSDQPGKEQKPFAIGTISNANMLPSTIDTFLELDETTTIAVDHQVGDDHAGLYLQVDVGGPNHIFARISIHRL
jgi:hypothetical protein